MEETLGKEETDKIREEQKGKFREVDKPLQVGVMTLERLYHSPSYSNKVSTSLFGTDVNPRRDQPLMNRGRYRVTGQKIGEMELMSLLSSNSKKFIESSREKTAQGDNQEFLNNLLALGLTISDSKGYNLGGSDLKSQLDKMKKKFRIKNNK